MYPPMLRCRAPFRVIVLFPVREFIFIFCLTQSLLAVDELVCIDCVLLAKRIATAF